MHFFKLSRHRTVYQRLQIGYFGHICQIWGSKDQANVHITYMFLGKLQTDFPDLDISAGSNRTQTMQALIESSMPAELKKCNGTCKKFA